ncbi:140_t:CDS:2, partial [Scutellospora calospora]
EITGCKETLDAGIPNGKIAGFCTYTPDVSDTISKLGFKYDSSRDDTSWPYTLDKGLHNYCSRNYSCDSVKHPSFWEIPMPAIMAPKIDKKICNGLNDTSLLEICNFNNTNIWSTYYGCPNSDISLAVLVPPETSPRTSYKCRQTSTIVVVKKLVKNIKNQRSKSSKQCVIQTFGNSIATSIHLI